MKYLKKYEARSVNQDSIKALQSFLEDYNKNKKRYNEHPTYKAKMYNIPEIFYDEFCLLSRLYDFLNNSWIDKEQKNYIKKIIKKQTLNSIKQKFEEDEKNYFDLKKVFEDRPKWNDSGSLRGISDAIVKYIFYLFEAALKNPPEFIKNMNKYNL